MVPEDRAHPLREWTSQFPPARAPASSTRVVHGGVLTPVEKTPTLTTTFTTPCVLSAGFGEHMSVRSPLPVDAHPIWQFAVLPNVPEYWRATHGEATPARE